MTIAALAPPAPSVSTTTRTHRISTANRETAALELRSVVAALLGIAGHGPLVEAAKICTSELVTNVFRHTGAKLVHVEVTLGDREVSVYVYDDQPRALAVPTEIMPAIREDGRGLILVNDLADAWGATYFGGLRPHSKAVWFRMVKGGRGAS
ncbi:ATP-binding protein [Streptomyces xanthochromogenes]|uniref:ATP-binding protein n=1 Tax=Streptomyces xanthochromogenes TaxID=67384 RepID=UPI0016792C46|nr:ATP-binding protein [Streptomyces xanthochromogenes]